MGCAGGKEGGGALMAEAPSAAPAGAAAPALTHRPLVVCGPSGVGKGTLITKLMADYPNVFGFSVSHTTRAPRPGEIDGTHYHFTDRESVLKEIADGLFLEHADVHGNIYGTSLAAVAKVKSSGRVCILDIDVQGATSVKKAKMDAAFVIVIPPSMEELERRLRGRATESEEKILVRLANAHAEYSKKDEPGFFDTVILNADLETAYSDLKEFIGKSCNCAEALKAAA